MKRAIRRKPEKRDPLPENPTPESQEEIEKAAMRAVTNAEIEFAKKFVQHQESAKFYAVLVFDTEEHCTDFLESCNAGDLLEDEWRRYIDGHAFAKRIGKTLTRPRPNLRPSQSSRARWAKHVKH